MKDLKYIAAIKNPPAPYNDTEIGADGDFVMLSGTPRVKQDVVKALITESGLLPYPNYGTSLSSIPGASPFTSTLLNNISAEVISAVHYLVFIEESQISAEQIAEITKLEVSFANSAINVALAIMTKDKAELTVGFSV